MRTALMSCIAIAGFLATAAPSRALVGPAESGAAHAPHTIMVLARGAGSAGFCSGAVIGPKLVLTAAHCVGGVEATRVHFRDAGGKPVLLAVSRVARHPGFRADAIAARAKSIDLALVETSEPLPSPFAPAPLGVAPASIGAKLTIAGYGVTREGVAASAGTLLAATQTLRAPLSNVLLWLDADNGAGACTGDSGGPVFDGNTVVGIVAFSQGDGRGRKCGTLTQAVRVDPYRAWIGETAARWR